MLDGAQQEIVLEDETLLQNAAQQESDKKRSDLSKKYGGKYFLDVKRALEASQQDGYGLDSPSSPITPSYSKLSPCSKVEKKYEKHGEKMPEGWRDKYNEQQARGKLRVLAFEKSKKQTQLLVPVQLDDADDDKELTTTASSTMGM